MQHPKQDPKQHPKQHPKQDRFHNTFCESNGFGRSFNNVSFYSGELIVITALKCNKRT